MHLNSHHAEGDLLTYLGLPVDFSVIPYESEWNKIIYTLKYYLSSLSTIMPKFLEVEKENMKKNIGLRLPEFLLRMKILPEFLLRGKIQNGGTHDFEDVNFYCFLLSSKNDNAVPSYYFGLWLRWMYIFHLFEQGK